MTDIEHPSAYDPSRPTVGAIYRDAVLNNSEDRIENGDMTNVMMKSLVEDLNDTIQEVCKTSQWEGREFYITVHESKDLAMKTVIKRRMVKTLYRPYPEDDTLVFRINAPRTEVRFCWCLPHHTEMDNILENHLLFDPDLVRTIREWKRMNLEYFGFIKIDIGDKYAMNPYWTFEKDHKLEKPRRTIKANPMVVL